MPERVQYVDEHDNPVGAGTREEAWANNYTMRHSHIFLRDENDRILLAKRSPKKKSSPNCWSSSAAGHVDEGESYDTAASRELFEELGVRTELTHIGTFRSQHPTATGNLDAFVAIYTGAINSDTPVVIDPEEVAEAKWFNEEEIRQLIVSHPDMFTINFRKIFTKFFS